MNGNRIRETIRSAVLYGEQKGGWKTNP